MTPRLRRHRLAAAAALLCAAALPQARADAAAAVPGAMLVVEVVGVAPQPGAGVDRNVLPYAVQSADGRALRRERGDNLSDFMGRNLAGVNVNEISGSPFQNDVTYRGFRASPVLGTSQGLSVYLDGVRVNEPFGDVVNWDMLPEAAIGSILLVPGSNPLYGLNTLGGALALRTKSGRDDPGLEAGLSYSGAGQRRADLAYGVAGEGNWHTFIAATLFDDGGWREHSAGRLGNVLLKLGHSAGATEWDLTLLGGQSRLVGNGLLPSYRWSEDGLQNGLYEDNRRAAYTFPDETRNRLRQATINASHRFDQGARLALTAYARNSRRDTVNGDGSEDYGDYLEACGAGFGADGAPLDAAACPYTREQGAALHSASLNTSSTRQQSYGLGASVSAELARHQLTAGASFDHAKVSFAQFEQEGSFTAQRGVLADPDEEREAGSSVVGASRAFGLYVADTWRVGDATHLTASARWNHARVANTLTNEEGAQAPESFTYAKLNPSLGLAHSFGGVSVFANVAQGTRVPTVIELGCADPEQPCRLPVGLQSDPYLKQVVARTIEAGARGKLPGGAWSASLYRTVNRDDILFRSAGLSQQGYFSNFERTRHQGLDLSANGKLGRVEGRLSYSYLDARYDADGSLFTGARNVPVGRGTRIAGLPQHTVKLALDWKATAALTLGASLLAVSDMTTQGNEDGLRADPVAGEPLQYADWRIRGYALLGLHASYRPDRNWEWFARVNNVANRRTESFGAVAQDMFPNGRLLQPQDGPVEAAPARFVAPGAPRSVVAGLRYRF